MLLCEHHGFVQREAWIIYLEKCISHCVFRPVVRNVLSIGVLFGGALGAAVSWIGRGRG